MIAIGGLFHFFDSGSIGYDLRDYEGYRDGYREGRKVGYIEGADSGYTLRNPTYSELRDFMEENRKD